MFHRLSWIRIFGGVCFSIFSIFAVARWVQPAHNSDVPPHLLSSEIRSDSERRCQQVCVLLSGQRVPLPVCSSKGLYLLLSLKVC